MGKDNGNGKKKKKRGGVETSRQLELYNEYQNITPQERSLKEVANKYNISLAYVGRLSGQFRWVVRAHEHDTRMLAKLEQRADRDFIADRVKRLRQIDTSIDVAQKLIEETLKKIMERLAGKHEEGIKIRNAYDLAQVMRASRDFIELEQLITGGIDPSRITLVQQIQQIYVGLIPENIKKSQIHTGG